MAQEVKTNSLKAWYLATRPKTLSAAAVPVLIGIAFAIEKSQAYGGFSHWTPAVLCLLFAWVMQINSNLINDYFDFMHGNDDETRLGPKRACAEGWITPRAMKQAIAITSTLGCLVGLPLILYGGMEMILVGAACVVFCFLYTILFSYHGMGDILVLIFFGIIPVCFTYYLCMPMTDRMPAAGVVMASIACGLVVDTLLMVNNYRDRDNDERNKKITLVVRIGEKKSRWLYEHLGFIGTGIMCIILFADLHNADCWIPVYLIYIVYEILHVKTYHTMARIDKGRELNKVLGMTARNIFVFGIVTVAAILATAMIKGGAI